MRTLVITGGSSGIGKATASLFAERGWCVFELSRHGKELAEGQNSEAESRITHIYCDVRDANSVREAV